MFFLLFCGFWLRSCFHTILSVVLFCPVIVLFFVRSFLSSSVITSFEEAGAVRFTSCLVICSSFGLSFRSLFLSVSDYDLSLWHSLNFFIHYCSHLNIANRYCVRVFRVNAVVMTQTSLSLFSRYGVSY